MICVHCGKQLDNDAEYCSRCGKKVIHVPPVFTMTGIGTDIAAEAIRDYSEWGFYNNPDAELDPETGRKPEYSYSALDALPDENPMKWARDFMEADAAEAAGETFAAEEAEEPEEQEEFEDGELDEEFEEEDEPEAKAKRKIPIAVIVIAVVILAGAIAASAHMLFSDDKTYEVNLQSVMTEPKVIGYNGFGEMALMPQIDQAKEEAWLRDVTFDDEKEGFKEVFDTVKYTPDKTEKLSNGDTVTIKIEYDKKLAAEKGLTVEAPEVTYEVSGLEKGKDLAYDPGSYDAYYDDFILPESDKVKLTREDVIYSTDGSADQIQQAINEIYARHGYIFGSEYYDKLFRGFKWYVPMYEPEKFDNAWLNEYEKANLGLLTQYRDELREAEKKAAEEKAKAEEAAKKAAEEKAKQKQTTEATKSNGN